MTIFTLPTSINLKTAQSCLESGIKAIDQNILFFDFSTVIETDTSVLAVMFAWLRYAQKQSKHLEFRAIPQPVTHLAKVYGVIDLINPNLTTS